MDYIKTAIVNAKFSKKEKYQISYLKKFNFTDCDGGHPDFAMLCNKLDEDLDHLIGIKFERQKYDKFNQRDNIHDVVIVYDALEKPVACGSFRMYDNEHAEIKRVYVSPDVRRLGLGAEIVRCLELKAKIKGYGRCILETGEPLEAACHMYRQAGYQIIPNYGPYADMPESICMGKKI